MVDVTCNRKIRLRIEDNMHFDSLVAKKFY